MSDIIDYLKWRSDVPFSVAPFNDVDNLILSELAYSDFSDLVSPDITPVPLEEVCDRFFQTPKVV